jgi:hypothetical protein
MAGTMLFVELFSLVVLAVFVAVDGDRRATLRDAGLVALGAFLGEDSCIRLYEYYAYSPGWHVFLDRVPLVVLLIWPAVVLSATKIAKAIAPRASALRLGAMVMGIVVFDAALIEPIAVHAGLWHWAHSGIFHVPVIGILGWGFYAGAIVVALESLRGSRRLLAPPLAALATHAMLLAAHWGLFRYVLRFELAFHVSLGLIVPAALAYAQVVVRTRATLGPGDLVARALATSLFVVLLARSPSLPLVLYASAFTLPHLVLVAQSLRTLRAGPRGIGA